MTSMYHPLQTFRNYTCNDYRNIINAKRKSAAEVLEETKPFYVKSPAALKSHSPDDKHRDESSYSPRTSNNRRQPERSCDLESKLRRLLDSKENLREEFWDKTEVQYKSLPDLSTSSHESLNSTLHHISCTEGVHTSNSEGTATTETGCSSSEKSYGKPPSLNKSCTSMGGSAGKVEPRLSWRCEDILPKLELTRSKSDPGESTSLLENDLPPKLEEFFQFLGLTSSSYRNLTRVDSDTSIPVYFPSGSSVDSSPCTRGSENTNASTGGADVGLSIVERNARVIKWLVTCAKS